MLLAGASRRSRVRRIVLLAHTFGYAVLLGVVAWAGCRVEVFLSQPARLSAALFMCVICHVRVFVAQVVPLSRYDCSCWKDVTMSGVACECSRVKE